MKLKILTAFLIISGLFLGSGLTYAASKNTVPNSFVYQAISKYRNKNYTGCIQDMDYAISHGKASDIAYYYKALSYARLGMSEEAKSAYESASQMTSNRILAEYANQAIACIDDPSTCDSNLDDGDISKFIRSNQFMHQDVKNALKEQAMERVQSTINSEAKPSEEDLKYINQNNAPSDKEIADAVRTFQKLGINPLGNSNMNMAAYNGNAELMQINAMLNNQNSNNDNMMNLIPMISAMQTQGGSNNVNKEFIQAYMLNQMLPSFNFGNNDKK